MSGDTRGAVEEAARSSFGKVLSVLLREGFPLEDAEDALGTAISRALSLWPKSGVPSSPEGWLLVVSRRLALDAKKKNKRLVPLPDDLGQEEEMITDLTPISDERLRLFFLCAHPAIDPAVQTPLMLQLILGFSAEEIAAIYFENGPQIGQRLVRAKKKIRDAGIIPKLPSPDEVTERMEGVLEAVYGAYSLGWEQPDVPERMSVAREGLRLAETLRHLAPDCPEAKGLFALLAFSEARRPARRGPDGQFVPLDEQDTNLWDRGLLAEAEEALTEASRLRHVGRFQIEAAIQSFHCHRLFGGMRPGRSS